MAYKISLHLRNIRDVRALGLTKKILEEHIHSRYGMDASDSHIRYMLEKETEWEMLGVLTTAEYRIILPMYSGFGHKSFCSKYGSKGITLTRILTLQSVCDKCLDYFASKDIPFTWSEYIE